MNQANELDVLRQVYGAGIHLYHQGVMYEGWFLVPIDWGEKAYTVSCFDPNGNQNLEWHHYSNVGVAIRAGQELVNQIINRIAVY